VERAVNVEKGRGASNETCSEAILAVIRSQRQKGEERKKGKEQGIPKKKELPSTRANRFHHVGGRGKESMKGVNSLENHQKGKNPFSFFSLIKKHVFIFYLLA